MRRIQSLLVALCLVFASAVAAALAFPPWNLRPLAFVCLVPLLLALRPGGLARAMGLATIWAVLCAWSIASIFPPSLAHYYERPLWFGIVAGLLVFTLMAGVYYAAFAAVDRALRRWPSAFTPLLVAAAWTCTELARGRLFTGTPFLIGNPWGLLGYTHASGVLAQIASLTGVYGIGFTLVAVNAGIADVIASAREPATRRRALIGMSLAVVPVVVSAIYGTVAFRRAGAIGAGPAGSEVAIIQGNVSIDRHWRSDYYARNLDVYLRLTHRALATGSPRLVVWPESALNFFVETEPRHLAAIEAVLRPTGTPLLVGGPSADPDGGPAYFNSAFLIDPRSGVRQRYDKEHLVPFAEYFPAASLDWMKRRIEGARVFAPGPSRPAPLDTPIGRAGILICNEAMLPEVAGDRVRAGAQVLISPSNDGWIAGRAFGEHMLAVVGLRAVEQRRYLVRASTAGPSAIIDPWGRVVARTQAFEPEILGGETRTDSLLTPYARFGDAFACSCGVAVVLALGFGLRRERASRSGMRQRRPR